jgi:hypothetical protein
MQAVFGRLHADSQAAVAIEGSDLILTEVRITFADSTGFSGKITSH